MGIVELHSFYYKTVLTLKKGLAKILKLKKTGCVQIDLQILSKKTFFSLIA